MGGVLPLGSTVLSGTVRVVYGVYEDCVKLGGMTV
jgi:hypothetical protein